MNKELIIPHHVAIIMDGNRRWARKNNLTSIEGHMAGSKNFKKIAESCYKMGVKILTVYAFSTENWKREKIEVNYLMKLLALFLKKELATFSKKNIKLNIIGEIEKLPESVRRVAEKVMRDTKDNKKRILNLAISYGGRTEILRAVKKIIKDKINPDKINEELLGNYLYTAGQPDPDILIRTSGEMRTSNFLPWQCIYSELYFSQKLWPDFSEKDLEEAISEFRNRQRRLGK